MSSFEKVVKNACKPKPYPPKSKVRSPSLSGVHTQLTLPLSTLTQSSLQHGQKMAPSMMSAKPFPLAFESQTLSSVLPLQSRGHADETNDDPRWYSRRSLSFT